ncbi:MAG: cyanoglobin [Myxococcales bacterium]|nr:cyanoglobin [Myxococcales bacterium]MCB9628359.1 cyanoglobin [Sandaracinaceae bacterium]
MNESTKRDAPVAPAAEASEGGAELTPFDLLALEAHDAGSAGSEAAGRARVDQLAQRFYDIMEVQEPALAMLHARDAQGRIDQGSRERFSLFLLGWLGGPGEYMERYGHPRLRMRHARVPVDIAMRDAWLRCMSQALTDCGVSGELRTFLDERFAHVANFLRNIEG